MENHTKCISGGGGGYVDAYVIGLVVYGAVFGRGGGGGYVDAYVIGLVVYGAVFGRGGGGGYVDAYVIGLVVYGAVFGRGGGGGGYVDAYVIGLVVYGAVLVLVGRYMDGTGYEVMWLPTCTRSLHGGVLIYIWSYGL